MMDELFLSISLPLSLSLSLPLCLSLSSSLSLSLSLFLSLSFFIFAPSVALVFFYVAIDGFEFLFFRTASAVIASGTFNYLTSCPVLSVCVCVCVCVCLCVCLCVRSGA